MTFSDGGSMTILVTQYKCHYYAFVMKTHIFSDDNGSSRIVKSLVVVVSGVPVDSETPVVTSSISRICWFSL